MKLNITFERDADTGREKAVITDDRGERMPGVRAVNVDYVFDRASEVTIRLVVDRKTVTLGAPSEFGEPVTGITDGIHKLA
jgi:hypothetical protein